MGFFKYPYTDLNELNLDWVIAKIKYIEQASHIIYDNTGTPLVANNVQDAINEILNMIASQGVTSWNGRSGVVVPVAGDYSGAMVTYDNSGSGLTATNVQAAVDEVQSEITALPSTYVESFNTRTGAVTPAASDYDADQIDYDNTVSGLASTDVQGAIDELAAAPGGVTSFNTRTGAVMPAASDYDADQVDYDNTTSGLTATDVQAAIDELDDAIDNFTVDASQVTYDNSVSGLTATDAQAAIDEIANDVLSSGVASFNGRTGAVSPASGDYSLTMQSDVVITTPSDGDVLKYDANSLKWINGSGAALPSGAEILVGHQTFTNTTTTDTIQTRMYNVCQAILTYASGLANDEYLVIDSLSARGAVMQRDRNSEYTNQSTAINERFAYIVSGTNTDIYYSRLTTSLSTNELTMTRLATTPAVSINDYASVTHSSNVTATVAIYKKY